MIVVERVSAQRLLPLRHRILRAGLPPESAHFDGDDEPTAVHLAAIDMQTQEVVGCCTLIQRPWNDAPAWQLRGMAVEPSHQGRGVGALLLNAVDELVARSSHSRQLWCNARSPAVGFYHRHGWEPVGDEFDIPTAGPHRRMAKREQR